jgi:hypothetical protein
MTPTAIAHRVWSTRSGVGLLIAALVAVILVLLYLILVNVQQRAVVISYGSAVYAPDKAAYCPGDDMRFPVQVTVTANELPSIAHVVEAWRRDSDGLTLQTTATVYEVPIVRPVDISTTGRRKVPELSAGVYWLDHVSVNGREDAYSVGPVTILDCQ